MNENEENICQCGHEKEWHHPIAGTTCCIHEMPSIGHGVTLCGCSPFRPAPQGTPESNFMQVGRAIECGHCNPEKFGAGLKQAQEMMGEDFKCECVCHDPIPSWEGRFHEMWDASFDRDGAKNEPEFTELKDFIRTLLHDTEQSAREKGKKEGFIEGAESMKAKAIRAVKGRWPTHSNMKNDILDALNKLTP